MILESCLLSTRGDADPRNHEFLNTHKPMTALVLHYDQNLTSVCEATGLICPHEVPGAGPVALARDKMTVLVFTRLCFPMNLLL